MNEKQSLSLAHWGLERWPFRGAPRAHELYPTASLTEGLARIEFLIEGGRRMGVVMGQTGVGKSLVLQSAAQQLARQGRCVATVDATAITTRELAWQTASGLGAAPREDFDAPRLWRQIADRLAENRLQHVHSVLLVDSAGLAGPDLLSQLVRLARLDSSPAARWTIVLATELEQTAHWSMSLRDLVDLRIDLLPWSADETIGFIQMALFEAGRTEPLFDEEALSMLHQLTRGVPRQVVRLADFALLAGAAAGRPSIDAITIEAAHEELSWPVEVALY